MNPKVVDFALFQAAWFACVLGAAAGHPWLGPVFVGLTLPLRWRGRDRLAREGACLAAALGMGLVLDGGLRATELVAFPAAAATPGIVPAWMSALWANLALALRGSLAFLRGRLVLAAVFGACGGPVAYMAGARLGAITLTPVWPTFAALAVGWGVAMTALVAMAWSDARSGAESRTAETPVERAA